MRRTLAIAATSLVLLGLIVFGVWRREHRAAKPVSSPAPTQPARPQRPPVPVVSAMVGKSEVVEYVESLGQVQANESVVVSSRVEEMVAKVLFEDGAEVAEGQPLVELHSDEEEADLKEARANLVLQEKNYQRFKALLAQQVVSRAEFDAREAEFLRARARVSSLEARRDDRVVRAPFSGSLGLRQVSPGTMLEVGTPIVTLDDLSRVKIDFTLPEIFLGRLAVGMEMSARSEAWPERTFRARVATITPRVEAQSRAVTLRALIDNEDRALKPGMLLSVNLVKRQEQAVTVPEESLVPSGASQFVFVVREGKSERRQVRLGVRAPGKVEIVDGLAEGERIVVRGVNRVTDGGAVREAETAEDRQALESSARRTPGAAEPRRTSALTSPAQAASR